MCADDLRDGFAFETIFKDVVPVTACFFTADPSVDDGPVAVTFQQVEIDVVK